MVTQSKRKNVIWVFGDQHRGQALSCAGDPNLRTPNVDRLAAEGVWFRQAVMGFPLSCPCRGSLLTGVYPHHCVPGHEHQMPPEMPTVAHPLNDAGYHTAWFGKWHVDGFHESEGRAALHTVPRGRRGGFQTWLGYENNNAQWDCYVHGHRGQTEVAHERLPRFETDALTDLFLDYLETRAEEPDVPFFGVLSVQPPHDPYTAPPEWMDRHNPAAVRLPPNVPDLPHITEPARRELAGYYALIENLDWNLGRIREALWELGLADDTYIIFFSDHGDQHGSHGHFRKMTPYQESIHVPMIVAGADAHHYRTHHQNDAVFNHVDLVPTTLGLCDVPIPEHVAGHDYSVYRRRRGGQIDPASEPDSAYLQSVVPTGHGPSIDLPWRGVTTRDGWKYVAYPGTPAFLFNLNHDPHEQVNLAHHAHSKGKRKELNDLTRRWIERTDDRFELPDL